MHTQFPLASFLSNQGMRFFLLIPLLFYSAITMTQDLKTENTILRLNQIKSQRFEADSIKAYFFVVNTDNLHDFIQYDSREFKSETHLRILSEPGVSADSELQNEENKAIDSVEVELISEIIALTEFGMLELYQVNDSNYFLGSPISPAEGREIIEMHNGYRSKLNITDYIIRIEEYYVKGFSDQRHLLVIGPMARKNGKTQVLFWAHLFHLVNDRTIQMLNIKDCSNTLILYKNKDF